MKNKNMIVTSFGMLLFGLGQSVYARLFYGACPSGTVGTPLGSGFINARSASNCAGSGSTANGIFFPSTEKRARPVYDCAAPGYQTTISTTLIERTAYSAINLELMSKAVKSYISDVKINKLSASSDVDDYKPDSFWAETNVSSLTEHANKVPGVASNVYQFTGAADKRRDNLFYGAAITYAYTDTNQTCDNDSTVHTVGITPYIAYKINDYLFVSGLASYYYSNTTGIAEADINTHDYLAEANINTFKVIDSFTLKGRAGVRYKHTNSSQKVALAGRDNTFDEITGILDGQVDYRLDDALTLYTGVLYNHYAREDSGASSLVRRNFAVWLRYGAEYSINKAFLIGAKIENDINDTHMNYLTGSVNVRLEL